MADPAVPATAPEPDSVALRVLGRAIGIAIVAGAAIAAVVVGRDAYRRPRTDDAAVRVNVVGIAPHVSGPIVKLAVVDNQEVPENAVLFEVDARPFTVALERARAELLLVESENAAIEKGIAGAGAEMKRIEAELAYARAHRKRLEPMVPQNYVTKDRLDEADAKAQGAEAALEKAREDRARLEQQLAQHGNKNARLEAARAAVAAAELDLAYCTVRAPFPARVTNLNISSGEYARAGQQVFALVDTRATWVLAYFRETLLPSIRPGMAASVFLPAYPGRRFRGTVQGIGWALQPEDGATVGVLPEVAPTVNWVRLARRMPVRIRVDAPDAAYPMRMGMSAVVQVLGGTEPAASAATTPP
jgi:membrane fusion protein, multidrug efflux system